MSACKTEKQKCKNCVGEKQNIIYNLNTKARKEQTEH